mmetsp:Transcript_43868/g.91833  ORF Transcript_43868/g.91833 Transcript_43868/m.91833 type:complete len:284 (-) Transcript_43868:60-911(-)
MIDVQTAGFHPVLVRRQNNSSKVFRVTLLLIAGLAIALFVPSARSKSSASHLPTVLIDWNVDLATLPPDLQMKALHDGPGSTESRSQGRAKYDDLLANGPLGTATSSQQSLDLETLSPKAQIRALASANSPSNTHSQQSAKKKDDSVKLGSSIGLDGSIHLLRSARQIIAERLARAHGISPTVRRAVEGAVSSPTSHRQPQRTDAQPEHFGPQKQQKPSLSDSSSPSSDDREQKPAELSAEAKLKAEEARLRSSVADLERRAADTEVSDDQGLLGGPAPPSDV